MVKLTIKGYARLLTMQLFVADFLCINNHTLSSLLTLVRVSGDYR